MFKAIVELLFPSSKNKPNYYYFEESRKLKQESQADSVNELQRSLESKPLEIMSVEEKHQKAFYDFLFGQSPPTVKHDELSLYVAQKIEKLLANPVHIFEALPALPLSLSKVIEQLSDEAFDTNELLQLIQQEPVVAAKVLELANSSFYNRNHKEVDDLKSAFMRLGANGLIEGVINGFISKLTPHSPLYFQQYGKKIWQHSVNTGEIAKQLLHQSPAKHCAATGYLVGLLCNLGDMIIYQLLLEAFTHVHPDFQPNSYAFKEVMLKNSKKITYFVAKHWHFPPSILDALLFQAKLTKTAMLHPQFSARPLACYVYEANILSELVLQFDYKHIQKEYLMEAKDKLVYSLEAKQFIDQLISTTDSGQKAEIA